MDPTAIGIVVGVVATLAYTLIRAFRQKTFDVGATILIFLGGFSLPGGTQLILAGWSGSISNLPSSWREYVVVAGIATIGLSAHFMIQSFKNVVPKNAKSE